jgi:predicted AlkP superfamily phosphohydrolase/phosphomutase
MELAGATSLASMVLFSEGCSSRTKPRGRANGKRVIVLGIDGVDPLLCERLMDAGRMPNFQRLRAAGGYRRLGTSIPPQSPVAWANFITGANPGAHGIFDFIHRDPTQQCVPYFAAAQTTESEDGWEVGEHKIPLTFWPFNHAAGGTNLRREGTAFWDYLDEAGIPAWIYDIPSNYPPSPSRYGNQFSLAGMGTPDLFGSYGTYQHFSTKHLRTRQDGGGMRCPLRFVDDVATGKLVGPQNTMLKKPVDTEIEFQIYRHPKEQVARIELQGRTIVLRAGEWSGWERLSFPLEMPRFLPNEHVPAICRFYLQEVHPNFRLYVSPLNIDPADPGDQRISTPKDFVENIADELGPFYTTGFQEDHKALSNGVFTDDEYRTQADYVLKERLNLLDYALRHYEDGFLFFYISSTDLQAHMFWWDTDEKHPIRDTEAARKGQAVIEDLYARMDGLLGDMQKRYPDATLMVVSDHGFCHFRRQFNLNTWLRDEGYIGPSNCDSLFASRRGWDVDWNRTRAYGLGLNGLYLNLRGRERYGIVEESERDALLEEIRTKLLAVRDPENGELAIANVYRAGQVYSGDFVGRAPDLIIGYARGYRYAWATALGSMSREVFSDNDMAWSADHCMAAEQLPGVVFSSKPIHHDQPALTDMGPTILEEFGVTPPKTMTGRSILRPPTA